MKKLMPSFLSLSFVLGLLTVSSAYAATATTTFPVTATVASSCSVAATAMAFGSYNPAGGGSQAGSSTISVTCTNGTPYNVGLDAGTGSGASTTVRKMTNGSSTLNYSIYQNAGRSTLWGNTPGTDTVAGTGIGTTQSLTAYGQIFGSQQAAAVGSYADTVTVTVTY